MASNTVQGIPDNLIGMCALLVDRKSVKQNEASYRLKAQWIKTLLNTDKPCKSVNKKRWKMYFASSRSYTVTLFWKLIVLYDSPKKSIRSFGCLWATLYSDYHNTVQGQVMTIAVVRGIPALTVHGGSEVGWVHRTTSSKMLRVTLLFRSLPGHSWKKLWIFCAKHVCCRVQLM